MSATFCKSNLLQYFFQIQSFMTDNSGDVEITTVEDGDSIISSNIIRSDDPNICETQQD